MSDIELTDEERRAISSLKRLAKRWPDTLWIFCGSGSVSVMKTDDKGQRAHVPGGGYDQAYLVESVTMPNDGGDW